MHLARINRDHTARTNRLRLTTVAVQRVPLIYQSKGKLIMGMLLIAGAGTISLTQLDKGQRRTALQKL